MAARGSKKELSVRHENWVANTFNGKRSKSSGASVVDKGDVRAYDLVIECKMTIQVDKEGKPKKPVYLKQFEKVAQEAYEEGKTPMMALRFYDPESPIADKAGWIDLTLMLAGDTAEREAVFYDQN